MWIENKENQSWENENWQILYSHWLDQWVIIKKSERFNSKNYPTFYYIANAIEYVNGLKN